MRQIKCSRTELNIKVNIKTKADAHLRPLVLTDYSSS